MNNVLDCPDLESWQRLFDDSVAPEKRAGYERHLEACAACQQRLDRASADSGAFRGQGQRLGDPMLAQPDPTLGPVLARLRETSAPSRTAAVEPAELSFLRPAGRPDLLGLLGGYEVQEVLGAGSMGIVFKAYDAALDRLVAIKVLAPALAGSAVARKRFTREAQAAAAVCHEHIVSIHGVQEADGLPYLVMQYIAGESLQDRLDRAGPLDPVEVARLGMQTASGLAAAHAQGLIHRDIKPANLLVEFPGSGTTLPARARAELGRVKITDFGLARMVDDAGLTQHGVVAGTPEYMAPEQANGEPIDHRADLFSLGGVLYALCTGQPPFRGSTTAAVLHKLTTSAARPPRELNPDIPVWLDDLIQRLLAKSPERRIQSAAELAVLLERSLDYLEQPMQVNVAERTPPRAQPSERRSAGGCRRWNPARTGLLVLGLLAALGLTAWLWMLQGSGGPKEANPKPPARGHVVFDLRDVKADVATLPLYGPEAQTVARMEPQGLRITLPAGRGDTRPVGLELPNRMHGDFDFVLGYELIEVGAPLPQYGAGVMLRVAFDATSPLAVVLSRFRKPAGDNFGAHKLVGGADGQNKYLNNVHAPAAAARGKLRLVRSGPELRFLVSEAGNDFKLLQSLAIGNADVQKMSVECGTMYEPIALDVRLTELTLDAEAFPEGVPATHVPVVPEEAPAAPGDKAWLTFLVIVVLTMVGIGTVGGWLFARRRGGGSRQDLPPREQQLQAEPAPASLSVQCPQCGQTSRARAELAGKKVKCPHCSQAMPVPG